MRETIEHGFERYGHWLCRHARSVVVMMLLLTAGLVSQVAHLHIDTSTTGFLHASDPILDGYDAFRHQFGNDERTILAIEPPGGVFQPAFLHKLKRLHDDLERRVPHLDHITSLVNARHTRAEGDRLIVDDLMRQWPQDSSALEKLRNRAMSNPLYRNMLLSADGRLTTIILTGRVYAKQDKPIDLYGGFERAAGTGRAASAPPRWLSDAETSEMVHAIQAVVEEHHSADFPIQLAGSAVVMDVLKRSLRAKMRVFTIASLLLAAVVLLVLFRRVHAVLLPLLVVALSLAATLGMMGWTGTPIKIPTQILPSFLLAVGVATAVHILAIFFRGLQSGLNRETAIAQALGHSGLAVTMAGLTTAAGLASFTGAELAPIAELGRFACLGVLMVLLYTLILLPALLVVVPMRPRAHRHVSTTPDWMDRWLKALADFSISRARAIVVAAVLCLAIAAAGIARLDFSHKPLLWLPQDNPARQATEFVDRSLAGSTTLEVMIDTKKENGLHDPQLLADIDRLSEEFEGDRVGGVLIGKTLTLTHVLKEIHQALNEDRPEYHVVPRQRELVAQEFLLFENSGSDDLEDIVDSRFQLARLSVKTPWLDATAYPDLIADLEQRFRQALGSRADIQVTGTIVLLGRTMHAAMVSMVESYSISAVMISALMIMLVANLRLGLICMVPNFLPVIIVLGLMGWAGIRLDLFTMLIGSIAIGLAVDDTIHFMHHYVKYRHEHGDSREAIRRTFASVGRPMLATTLVLVSGFLVYLLSDMQNLFNFGLLTALTIALALIADFLVTPALVTLWGNSSVWRGATLSRQKPETGGPT